LQNLVQGAAVGQQEPDTSREDKGEDAERLGK
jgi:hypothetical protein